MRYQSSTLLEPRTIPLIVDDELGIPSQLIEDYHQRSQSRPPGLAADPRSQCLSSMSEFDKAQSYDVYDYQQAARPDQAAQQEYTSFAATHPQYTHDFVGSQAQAPSNLVQTSALPFLALSGAHDHQYYSASQTQFPTAALPPTPQHSTTSNTAASTTAFLESGPRQLPEVLSFTPNTGIPGVKISIHIQSQYDLQAYPQTTISIMFGHKRCDSVVSRVSPASPHQYVVSTTAPPVTGPSQVAVALAFEGPVTWQAPSVDVGSFTYTNAYTTGYPLDSPPASRKRKLSLDNDRRSPTKKQSYSDLNRNQSYYSAESSNLVRSQAYPLTRRVSQPGYNYDLGLPRVQTQHYYAAQPSSASSRLPGDVPSGYDYYSSSASLSASTRDQATIIPAARSAQLLPSPASTNPPLIRTSTLHQSPALPGIPVAAPQGFNPYAMYPANTKAMLKIDGDLNSMVEHWTDAELEAKRRLVQFQRSQQGSIITTTFEPVTLEERAPNSICVSCIWWQEKQECYVTSVDTIQLLESLVAVRFTVEEKNRIRRNLEGFRPATVSKTKADSEDFFKLIMGFPNPKPRNIEKDVKVFPWRILSTALKKIIGKYSASYSSTAGALHTPTSSYAARVADSGMDHRTLASPRSTSSSVTSHGHTYATAMTSQSYLPHAPTSTVDMSAGPQSGLRLTMPQASSWHTAPPQHYGSAHTDLSTATGSTARTPSWDYGSGMTGYGMTAAMPVTAAQYHSYAASSLLSAAPGQRWVPLHDYDQHGQPTTSGA